MSQPDSKTNLSASSLRQVIGALVFSANEALSAEALRRCLHETAETDESAKAFASVTPRDIREALADIAKDLERLELGIDLREVSGGFRFETHPACASWIRGLLKQERPTRLSRPAIETLAIVAYRQPIAKSELEGIRGVTVDHTIKALMEMRLIRIAGRSDLPGRPFLYGTTPTFLEHFGLKSLDELNELDPTLQRRKPIKPARNARNRGEVDASSEPSAANREPRHADTTTSVGSSSGRPNQKNDTKEGQPL